MSKPTSSAIRAENPSYTPGARIIGPGDAMLLRSLVAALIRLVGEMEPIVVSEKRGHELFELERSGKVSGDLEGRVNRRSAENIYIYSIQKSTEAQALKAAAISQRSTLCNGPLLLT